MSTSSKFSVTYTHTLTHPHTNGPINISPLTMRGDNKPKHLPVKSNNHFYNQRVSCHKIAHLVHLRSEINQSILIKASETEIMFYWYQKQKSCSTNIRNRNHVLLISEPEYCFTDIRTRNHLANIRTRILFYWYQIRNHLSYWYQNQKSSVLRISEPEIMLWYQNQK